MDLCCSILRLRGLPYQATEEDVKAFFGGYLVIATYFVARNGKPTGEAYVQFETSEMAADALQQRQHEHLGSRYVEIFNAVEVQLVGTTMQGAEQSLQGHVVRLRGLPFTSTSEDILDFLLPVKPVGSARGVCLMCNLDGRPNGEAYLELCSSEDLALVLEKDKHRIGTRYIEIFQATKGDFYFAVCQHGFLIAADGKWSHHHCPQSTATRTSAAGASDSAHRRMARQQGQNLLPQTLAQATYGELPDLNLMMTADGLGRQTRFQPAMFGPTPASFATQPASGNRSGLVSGYRAQMMMNPYNPSMAPQLQQPYIHPQAPTQSWGGSGMVRHPSGTPWYGAAVPTPGAGMFVMPYGVNYANLQQGSSSSTGSLRSSRGFGGPVGPHGIRPPMAQYRDGQLLAPNQMMDPGHGPHADSSQSRYKSGEKRTF